MLVEGESPERRKMKEFLYYLSQVHIATEFIFDYCGVRVADIKEVTVEDWEQVLACRHGDAKLEELFVALDEARAIKAAAYKKMVAQQ